MQIDLTSAEDTYLYLLRGADSGGTVDRAENDDVVNACNTNSRITETLAAGTYTIEATTYDEGVTGEFSLSIVPAGAAPPPATDGCFQTLGGLTAGVSPERGLERRLRVHAPQRQVRPVLLLHSPQSERRCS